MPTHTDRQAEAALGTAQQPLLDGWRDGSRDLRKLAQSLGHFQPCACGDAAKAFPGSCWCGGNVETKEKCLQCAVLLHTVAWRIDELFDEARRFLPAARDTSGQFGANGSTTRMDNVRSRVDALARTFEQIETLTQDFRQGCSAAYLPAIRRFADDLLIQCSALDEVLGFPRASSSGI
jgi:hypothetical protein